MELFHQGWDCLCDSNCLNHHSKKLHYRNRLKALGSVCFENYYYLRLYKYVHQHLYNLAHQHQQKQSLMDIYKKNFYSMDRIHMYLYVVDVGAGPSCCAWDYRLLLCEDSFLCYTNCHLSIHCNPNGRLQLDVLILSSDPRVYLGAILLLHQSIWASGIPVPGSPLPSKPPTFTLYTLALGAQPKFNPVAVPPQCVPCPS